MLGFPIGNQAKIIIMRKYYFFLFSLSLISLGLLLATKCFPFVTRFDRLNDCCILLFLGCLLQLLTLHVCVWTSRMYIDKAMSIEQRCEEGERRERAEETIK